MPAKTNISPRSVDDSSTIPPGWSRNPSERRGRFFLAALALVGFVVAGYLALYQLKAFSTVWEPFFGEGSHKLLDSSLSRSLPIPDAALGAAVYLLDAVLLLVGGDARWRTHPWVVLANGAISSALCVTGVVLLIVQPIGYDSYCTLCMVSAFISINLFGPMIEEVLASLQYLVRRYTYLPSSQSSSQSPALNPGATRTSKRRSESVSFRFLIGAAIGLWLMAAPGVLDYARASRSVDRVVGPVIFALCIASIWPATRWLGRLNIIVGSWLLVSPVVLQAPDRTLVTTMVCGTMLLALAVFSRPTTAETGGGWSVLMNSEFG